MGIRRARNLTTFLLIAIITILFLGAINHLKKLNIDPDKLGNTKMPRKHNFIYVNDPPAHSRTFPDRESNEDGKHLDILPKSHEYNGEMELFDQKEGAIEIHKLDSKFDELNVVDKYDEKNNGVVNDDNNKNLPVPPLALNEDKLSATTAFEKKDKGDLDQEYIQHGDAVTPRVDEIQNSFPNNQKVDQQELEELDRQAEDVNARPDVTEPPDQLHALQDKDDPNNEHYKKHYATGNVDLMSKVTKGPMTDPINRELNGAGGKVGEPNHNRYNLGAPSDDDLGNINNDADVEENHSTEATVHEDYHQKNFNDPVEREPTNGAVKDSNFDGEHENNEEENNKLAKNPEEPDVMMVDNGQPQQLVTDNPAVGSNQAIVAIGNNLSNFDEHSVVDQISKGDAVVDAAKSRPSSNGNIEAGVNNDRLIDATEDIGQKSDPIHHVIHSDDSDLNLINHEDPPDADHDLQDQTGESSVGKLRGETFIENNSFNEQPVGVSDEETIINSDKNMEEPFEVVHDQQQIHDPHLQQAPNPRLNQPTEQPQQSNQQLQQKPDTQLQISESQLKQSDQQPQQSDQQLQQQPDAQLQISDSQLKQSDQQPQQSDQQLQQQPDAQLQISDSQLKQSDQQPQQQDQQLQQQPDAQLQISDSQLKQSDQQPQQSDQQLQQQPEAQLQISDSQLKQSDQQPQQLDQQLQQQPANNSFQQNETAKAEFSQGEKDADASINIPEHSAKLRVGKVLKQSEIPFNASESYILMPPFARGKYLSLGIMNPVSYEPLKIVYCGITKTSHSQFRALFCHALLKEKANEVFVADPYQAHAAKQCNSFEKYLDGFSEEKKNEFYTSADWVRLATIRDPIDRFISGYVDKCDREKTRCYGCPMGNILCFAKETLSYMTKVSTHKLRYGSWRHYINHFYPQFWNCDFQAHLDDYSLFVYNKTADFRQEIRQRMVSYGIPESSIYSGWGTNGTMPFMEVGTEHATDKSVAEGYYRAIMTNLNLMDTLFKLYFVDYYYFPFVVPSEAFELCENAGTKRKRYAICSFIF